MAGGWGCPHEVDDRCGKLGGMECDPGMKGCVLAGRYRFLDDDKSARFLEKKARESAPETDATGEPVDPDAPGDASTSP